MRALFFKTLLYGTLLFLGLNNVLINAGFPTDTLVSTPEGQVPLQSLHVGDAVICFDKDIGLTQECITEIQEYIDKVIKIVFEDDTVLYVTYKNKIYSPLSNAWVCADQLRSGDALLTKNHTHITIKNVIAHNQPLRIFNISVKNHHNFCITQHGILVHNMNVLFEWVAENGSMILTTTQNALMQAGTAAAIYFSTKNSSIDYNVPQLPGNPGDQFRLNGKDFIYTQQGWKLQTDVPLDEIRNLKKQLHESQNGTVTTSVSDTDSAVIEPEYTYVGREGWGNDETWFAPVGTRLYKECCTFSDDGLIPYYDFARDAQITKDLKAQYEIQKQKAANKISSSGANDRNDDNKPCWCGCCFRGNIGECSCTCTCTCCKKKWNSSKDGYTYEYGIYAGASYHHINSTGNSKGGKGPAPKDGQRALDNSVEVGGKSDRRVGIDINGDFVVFDRTSKRICPYSKDLFHGHTRTWEELKDKMKNAVKKILK